MQSSMPPFVGDEDALTEQIIGVFYQVVNELGFGFLESVYCRAMAVALSQIGLEVDAELPVPVSFRGELVGIFRADLVVEGRVILELKTADQITKVHEAQLLHYLRASSIEIGLILNFAQAPKVRRMQFRNSDKALSKSGQEVVARS
jgi:GxxExxY protein